MKIIRIAYRVFSIFLVLALIAVTLLSLLLGVSGMDRNDPRSIFGFRAFVVLTSSMVPEFDAGSVIIIKDTDVEALESGDIITYLPMRGGDALLTHRIVRINEEAGSRTFITRGDANNTDDPNPVGPEHILGRTVFHMDGLGTFIVNLRTPMGIGILIAVIAIGLFIIPAILAPRVKKGNKLIDEEESEEAAKGAEDDISEATEDISVDEIDGIVEEENKQEEEDEESDKDN